jgi:hypothetical protein
MACANQAKRLATVQMIAQPLSVMIMECVTEGKHIKRAPTSALRALDLMIRTVILVVEAGVTSADQR